MNSIPTLETEHDFTLLLDGASAATREIEDALFAAGCDDATLSARFGRLFLSFSRTAPSLRDAIVSAVQAVNGCGQSLSVVRVDTCNFVTQADIARKMDRSRQQVHQYISGLRGPGDFPPPACNITEGMPLWYWCEVADWLAKNNLIKPEILRDAQELAAVNSVLELAHQKLVAPELTLGVMRELGVG